MKIEPKEMDAETYDILHRCAHLSTHAINLWGHILWLEQQLDSKRSNVEDIAVDAYGAGLKHCKERLLPRIAQLEGLLESRPKMVRQIGSEYLYDIHDWNKWDATVAAALTKEEK